MVELLVVLVIFGLVSALALPNLSRTYQSLSFQGEIEEIEIRLAALGRQAFFSSESIEIDDDEKFYERVTLPQGWSVQVLEPLIVRSNGVCIGGKVILSKLEFSKIVQVSAPHCSVPND
ncbi:MAG: type II secretion system protein [Pseudomonadales bacterium]|nr:type II secretion system protein [Pseudomonadales bacterium]MBO6596141.1 type II secretion system protein [Pseudomonadales bacterium]MBO6822621.1 type II secretion system protein [Pseudomonadales bacterium]